MTTKTKAIAAIRRRMRELNKRIGRAAEFARYLEYLAAYGQLERELIRVQNAK